jgi:P27 family predicted phage terminase small subunit
MDTSFRRIIHEGRLATKGSYTRTIGKGVSAMRGRKPKPTALKLMDGNPGKRGINHSEPKPPGSLPDCPRHLSEEARAEWHRIAESLNVIGLLTQVDRATMAAYCQCWGRWVEAEEKLANTPAILRTPAGYIQQSPWLSIANKQLELMARYMTELGLTPASRSRLASYSQATTEPVNKIELVWVFEGDDGLQYEKPISGDGPAVLRDSSAQSKGQIVIDGDL